MRTSPLYLRGIMEQQCFLHNFNGRNTVVAGLKWKWHHSLRPVGEVCVVGFHGGPGLDLCRQVNQIVRRLQGIGSMSKPYSQKQKKERTGTPLKGLSSSFLFERPCRRGKKGPVGPGP